MNPQNYAHCKRGYISHSPNDVHSLWECSIFPSGNKTYNPYRLLMGKVEPQKYTFDNISRRYATAMKPTRGFVWCVDLPAGGEVFPW